MKKHLLILLLACVASISASAYDFKVDGIYYNESGIEASVTYKNEKYNSYSGSVTIPASVTYNNVTYSVTSIGESAFEGCSGLTSVTIPNSVTSIGESAFEGCSGLTSVTIPNSVITIGYLAFYECRSLTSVTIPDSVTEIGNWAFRDCGVLTSVTIGNSVTSIGNLAFYGCGDLTSVTIPNSVITIGDWAFKGCTSLTSVTIPDSVTSIGGNAFDGTALYNNESNWENKVLYIGNHLIRAATDLTDEYTIKDGTVTIAGYAFFECSDLTSVTIPNSVITIGDSAFRDCYELTSVTIPNSVRSIGKCAFSYCARLTAVTVDNNDPANISLGDYVFEDVPTSKCILYVPKGSKELYAVADQWKDFVNIEEFVSGVEDVLMDNEFESEVSYYDLMGRRVVNPTNGIYIRNGKKVLVK